MTEHSDYVTDILFVPTFDDEAGDEEDSGGDVRSGLARISVLSGSTDGTIRRTLL